VPAAASSLTPIPARCPCTVTRDQCADLRAALAQLTDPRRRRGRRHPLVAVLTIAVAAMLAGHRSMAALAEWAADAPQTVLAALGARYHPLTRTYQPPTEATVRRVLTRIDAEAWTASSGPGCPVSSHHHPGRQALAGPSGPWPWAARL
jgi:DDE_Tnp_1-associated